MKRKLTAMALAVGVIAVFGGSAVAGHLADGVNSYTGCLVSKDGVIIKIKEGEAPTSPCTGGQVQVHFSGGDITAISAGTGLQGGGTNGAVTLALAPGFRLPQGCATGEIAKWDGSAWQCAADDNTTYTTGAGLELNGTELRIKPSYQLPQIAQEGDSIIWRDDSWDVEAFTRAGQSCPTGQFVRATAADGDLTCATSPASSNTYVSASNPGTGIPDDGANHDIVSLVPGSGTYFIVAKGTLTSTLNVDDFSAVGCELRVDGALIDEFRFGSTVTQTVTEIPFALTGAAPVSSGFKLSCYADSGADGMGIENAKLVGVKL
jgi:hypothetical protein